MRTESLNFHHLHHFWVVAQEGSLTQACQRLGLAPSTVSAQLKELESHFGHALFDRSGRRFVLTEQGDLAFDYANQIFALGSELDDVMSNGRGGRPQRVRVGVSEMLPKLVVQRLLEMALDHADDVQLHVFGDRIDRLVADVALHHVDLVLADEPLGTMAERSASSIVLGSSGLTVFGRWDRVRPAVDGFPGSLDGAPMLLPAPGTGARRQIDRAFGELGVVPTVVAEFTDSGLLKAFGARGRGLFLAPTLVSDDVCRTYDVVPLGPLVGVEETYHAMVPARDPEHPVVRAIVEGAQALLAHAGDESLGSP